MANYPTPPAPRIPYDLDGSVVAQGSKVLSIANSYNDAMNLDKPTGVAVVFPYPYDLYGYAWNGTRSGLQYSTDTTNGVDGTWTGLPGDYLETISARRAGMRTLDNPAVGVTGVRCRDQWRSLALYGYPTSAPDGLQVWDPTANNALAGLLDFGDTARGQVFTKRFRIKNHRATKATSITVADSTPDESTPATAGMFKLSKDDGATWSSLPVSLADIPAGDISPVLRLQYSPTVSALLDAVAARWTIAVGAWV